MSARWSLIRRMAMIAVIGVSCSEAGESSAPITTSVSENAATQSTSAAGPTSTQATVDTKGSNTTRVTAGYSALPGARRLRPA